MQCYYFYKPFALCIFIPSSLHSKSHFLSLSLLKMDVPGKGTNFLQDKLTDLSQISRKIFLELFISMRFLIALSIYSILKKSPTNASSSLTSQQTTRVECSIVVCTYLCMYCTDLEYVCIIPIWDSCSHF
jgi:hypothetical protein